MRKSIILVGILTIFLIGGITFAQEKDWIEYSGSDIIVYSPDGSYGIIIQDRNVGATMTGYGNTTATGSFGYHYQRGNNYGFQTCYTSWCTNFPGGETTSTTKVDTSDYGPDNPYSSNIFIKTVSQGDWSSVCNDNLRGGEGDDETNGWGLTSNNPITGRQGPCPAGYHVPSIGERNELRIIWYNNEYNTGLDIGDFSHLASADTPITESFQKDLLIPYSRMRFGDDLSVFRGQTSLLWSSTPDDVYADYLELLHDSRYHIYVDYEYRGNAGAVRCFKNDRIYVDVSKTLTLNVMSGENLVSTGISFSDETSTYGQILDAISWLSEEVGLSTGYHFSWYIDDGGVETGFDLDAAIAGGTITSSLVVTGRIEPNKYTISFLDENGTEIMSGEFTYDQEATLPVNTSTREGYTFKGWKDEQGNTYDDGATIQNLTTENGVTLEFVSIREKKHKLSGSSGGGNGGNTNKPDTQVQDDDQNSGNEIGHGSAELENGYSKEMNDAYQFAYQNGITTMDTIQKADMEGGLTRIAMAKMLAYYAINVLGMTPDKSRVNKFGDVTEKLDSEYDNGVNLAYQLGIMGINMRKNMFRPFDLVTRAEFGTALSRMLYGLADGKKLYYETHLKKLTEEKIITNNDPNLRELRGYVMIMLMRSAMTGYNWDDLSDEGLHDASQLEVENYFTEAYKMGTIYYRIGDLQRLLQYLGFYDGEINNTYDKNTVNAVYDFQVAMGILDIDDTKNPGRGYLGPSTRDALNQKRAEFK